MNTIGVKLEIWLKFLYCRMHYASTESDLEGQRANAAIRTT